MKITEHFSLEEFKCKDGAPYPEEWIEDRLMPLSKDLEEIRKAINEPLIITSGYRTIAYNKKIGGALFSAHTQGLAVDIRAYKIPANALHRKILSLIKEGIIKDGGLGLYPTWVHYDHGKSRRW